MLCDQTDWKNYSFFQKLKSFRALSFAVGTIIYGRIRRNSSFYDVYILLDRKCSESFRCISICEASMCLVHD